MYSCSEYVATGHPDSTCDATASYILDEFLKRDPKVRFALEVQLKDHICNLAGEVTSTWKPSKEEWAEMVKAAIRKVGYTAEYAAKWPEGATLNADKVIVNSFIGQQSPDIAQGVDREGWGDQGCFMGMATDEVEYGYMPRDHYLANEIGKRLYRAALIGEAPIGLDIKTLVAINKWENRESEQVIVAAPMLPKNEILAREFITTTVQKVFAEHNLTFHNLIINGTGAYVVHSSVGDAGVVGRKLAVNFYGLNCPIGGGSPFGKDATKADVSLNLMARKLSLKTMLERPGAFREVYTKIACCIGRSECFVSQFDECGNKFNSYTTELCPSAIIKSIRLDGSIPNAFYTMATQGLFTHIDNSFSGLWK